MCLLVGHSIKIHLFAPCQRASALTVFLSIPLSLHSQSNSPSTGISEQTKVLWSLKLNKHRVVLFINWERIIEYNPTAIPFAPLHPFTPLHLFPFWTALTLLPRICAVWNEKFVLSEHRVGPEQNSCRNKKVPTKKQPGRAGTPGGRCSFPHSPASTEGNRFMASSCQPLHFPSLIQWLIWVH